jgi:hypothetical protein
MNFSENRFPPPIKPGAGFFGIMLKATPRRLAAMSGGEASASG